MKATNSPAVLDARQDDGCRAVALARSGGAEALAGFGDPRLIAE